VTLSSACVAFAFAYFRFPGRNVLFAILLGTLMLPPQVTLIPTYLIWNEVGKFTLAHAWLPHIGTNTQYPLWMPNLFGSAFYIFLQRQFFLGIPRELFEAARIDGDSYFSMFRRIALPLAKPALIVTFIFEVQAKWFDLMTPLIYLRDSTLFTLPVGIKTILDRFGQGGGGEGDWQIIVAATLILTLPMIIIFALFQKYFIEGIATQGRKG
jgi:multiple sugar transport system permease protein